MKKIFIVVAMFLFLVGCGAEPTEQSIVLEVEDAGNLISAEVIKTNWSESQRMIINTDKYIFVVIGYHSMPIDASLEIVKNCWTNIDNDGLGDCLRVNGTSELWMIEK